MMFVDHDQYASGSSQEVDMPMMLDQTSFLQAPSDSAALSATSYTSSTPIEFTDDPYTSADVSMWDGEVGDAGQMQEGGELLCYGMV
jgi:hypothetical protein